jgi:hypothetical protein
MLFKRAKPNNIRIGALLFLEVRPVKAKTTSQCQMPCEVVSVHGEQSEVVIVGDTSNTCYIVDNGNLFRKVQDGSPARFPKI